MKTLSFKNAPRPGLPNRRAERRAFAILVVLSVAIWLVSAIAVQWPF